MQARCPHCRNVFATDRGGIQFCPHCGREIDVPVAGPTATGAGTPPPAEPPFGPGPSIGAPAPGEPPPGGLPPGGPPSGGPPPGEPPPPAPRGLTAWERRAELGFFPALWATWKEAMFKPTAFWADVRPDGSPVDALFYAWILYAISAVLSIPLSLATSNTALWEEWARQSGGQQSPLTPYIEQISNRGTAATLISIVVGVILFPLVLVIGTAILHVFALLFSAAKNGYWATFRVVCYALSPWVFEFFGCLFPFVFIYVLALTIFGLTSVQETTQGKAAATALVPLGLCVCCCCMVPVIAIGMGSFAAFSHAHP